MSNRRCWAVGVSLGVVLLVAAWFEPTYCVRGWLHREAFYQGRPSSYWAAEIQRWECTKIERWYHTDLVVGVDYRRYSRRPAFPPLFARFLSEPEPTWPLLFDGDAKGLPVLQELVDHPSEVVSEWAREGIFRISSGGKGPYLAIDEDGRRLWAWTDDLPFGP